MKLYYFKSSLLNFGDDLNPWIWQRILPDFFDENADELFVGIGTLLNHRIPQVDRILVFGSGVGYGTLPELSDRWDIICVRGPKSADALGLPPSSAVIDPAVLIHDLYPHQVARTYPVAFMPHCDTAVDGDWRTVCAIANVHYIDPRQPVEHVMSEIAKSGLLLAEAMHGAIAAEAFRIPWIPLICADRISTFKWMDWCASLNLDYAPCRVPPIFRGSIHLGYADQVKTLVKRGLKTVGIWNNTWEAPVPRRSSRKDIDVAARRLRAVLSEAAPLLSQDRIFHDRRAELYHRLEWVRQRYGVKAGV